MGRPETERWVAVANIERFRELMKVETDTCQLKFLEGMIVLEQEKLRILNRPVREKFGSGKQARQVLNPP